MNKSDIEKVNGVSRKCLNNWLNLSPKILQSETLNRSRLPEGGRKPMYPELEQQLLEWVTNQRNRKLSVTKSQIRQKALKLIENQTAFNSFKVSLSWVRKFCVRNFLTYRTATHQSQQKKRDTHYDRDVVCNFIKVLKDNLKSFSRDLVLNMDETPAYFDMVTKKTIDFIGTKTVDIVHSGHDKNRFSLVITTTASGLMLPTAIIFKGLKNVPNILFPPNVFVYVNHSGSMDSRIMKVNI